MALGPFIGYSCLCNYLPALSDTILRSKWKQYFKLANSNVMGGGGKYWFFVNCVKRPLGSWLPAAVSRAWCDWDISLSSKPQ